MRKKQTIAFNTTPYIYMSMFVLCVLILSFFGCSGDHEDYVSKREGRFIDTSVQGLTYVSGKFSGITDSNGTFFYEKGQDVTFKLGNITLGSIPTIFKLDITSGEVAPQVLIVTPRDLVASAQSDRDPQLTNFMQFLQSLDNDNNPDNGILLSDSVRDKANQYNTIDFSLERNAFETYIKPIVKNLAGSTRELRPAIAVQHHFMKTKLQFILDNAIWKEHVPGVSLVAEVPCPYTDDAICEQGVMEGVTYTSTANVFMWKLTSGYSDLVAKTPMTTDTRFRIASLTKTFVAMVIMQMVEEQKISLDDSIEKWLPGLIPNGENMQLRQIVNHTSGLYNFYEVPSAWFFDFLFNRKTSWTPEEHIELAIEEGPDFPPGAAWHYSNTNYVLLGMLIEKVTGNTWENEIRNRFITPYGLQDTIVPETGESNLEGPYAQVTRPGKYAHGYIDLYDLTGAMYGNKGGILSDASTREPSAAGSSACMISTAEDLYKWIKLIGEGKLFKPNNDYVNQNIDPKLYAKMTPVTLCGPNIYKNTAINMLIASGNFLGYDVGMFYDSTNKIPLATCSNRTLISGQIKDIVAFDAMNILSGGLPTNNRKRELKKEDFSDSPNDSLITYIDKDGSTIKISSL